MPRPRSPEGENDRVWKVCLECGNRFKARRHKSSDKWCSTSCQTESYRAGRHQILESLSIGSRWWL